MPGMTECPSCCPRHSLRRSLASRARLSTPGMGGVHTAAQDDPGPLICYQTQSVRSTGAFRLLGSVFQSTSVSQFPSHLASPGCQALCSNSVAAGLARVLGPASLCRFNRPPCPLHPLRRPHAMLPQYLSADLIAR